MIKPNFDEDAVAILRYLLEERKKRIVLNIANTPYGDIERLKGLHAELRVISLLENDLLMEIAKLKQERRKELEQILSHE
jgi:hypothetical protein